jgi:hypothetical protein
MGYDFPLERRLILHPIQDNDSLRFLLGKKEISLPDPLVKSQGFLFKTIFFYPLMFHSLPGPAQAFLDGKIEKERQMRLCLAKDPLLDFLDPV